jgi:glycosyltransferase involved in cell wall biosynthesis
MNILFLYRVFPEYGGVEVVTTILANRFVLDGHNVTIASFEQPHLELADKLSSGIELVKLNYPIYSLANIWKLRKELQNRQIDIIINQWGLPFKTTMLCNSAIKGTKCKLISVLHGSPYTSKLIIKAQDKCKLSNNLFSKTANRLVLYIKEQVVKWSIRYNVKHNARYILLSNSFIEPLVNYAGIKDSRTIEAIGNPITIDVNLDDFSFSNKKKQVLSVGRMDYENKRVNRIVESWEKVSKEFLDWELVLVGDGPHKSLLQNYIKEHKIERVRFEGFKKEPPIKYYKDAKIFMLTSDLEGFGLVIVESMAYGVVPIVYGSYEAVFDIIDDGENGFITPKPFDEDFTVQKMKKLMTDDSFCLEMGKNAMEKSKQFSIEAVISKWYNILTDVISEDV